MVDRHKVAIEPKSFEAYERAVEAAGGQVARIADDVAALIWTDYSKPAALGEMLAQNPQLEWVQLPFAGVDAFAEQLQHPVTFTSAKGSYRQPVAEHALLLTLALARKIPDRVRATSWGEKFAVSLYDSEILIVGGGGITEELLRLLAPFNTTVNVVRKHPKQMLGATCTVGFEQLDELLPKADFVILAAALTPETHHLIDAHRLGLMKPTSYLINIARGAMVNTDDLIAALNSEVIAGAATDVTDPEPLPEGHRLWSAKNILITPHTADTNVQVIRLFSQRIDHNVRAWLAGTDFEGLVDPNLGY